MKRETFVTILESLVSARKRNEEISSGLFDLISKVKPNQIDFLKGSGCWFEDWELTDSIICAIAKEFTYQGANDDINWWFYEKDIITLQNEDASIMVGDRRFVINTAGELYDYMMEMESDL